MHMFNELMEKTVQLRKSNPNVRAKIDLEQECKMLLEPEFKVERWKKNLSLYCMDVDICRRFANFKKNFCQMWILRTSFPRELVLSLIGRLTKWMQELLSRMKDTAIFCFLMLDIEPSIPKWKLKSQDRSGFTKTKENIRWHSLWSNQMRKVIRLPNLTLWADGWDKTIRICTMMS